MVIGGLMVMAFWLAALAAAGSTTAVSALGALMVLVGLTRPLIIPPITAVLLNSVPDHQAGTVSGVFNTGRQIGGALAVAVFSALLNTGAFLHGLDRSLLIAAGVVVATAIPSRMLRIPSRFPPVGVVEGV